LVITRIWHLAQNHQEQRLVSERWGTAETVLPSAAQTQPEMDHADSGLEGGSDSLYYPVRRPDE